VSDSLLRLEAPSAGLRLALCSAAGVARSASARHGLAAGSAAALAQGLTAALLLADHQRTRVDVQLECNGPLRGLLVDADESGAVRGLVRAKDLEGGPRSEEPTRFDGRPLLASPHDERAGALSLMCAPAGGLSAHRAAFPFAGADLGAALTLFLRSDREEGGEMALEVLSSAREPLLAVAGALISPLQVEDAEKARVLGKPLRQGGSRPRSARVVKRSRSPMRWRALSTWVLCAPSPPRSRGSPAAARASAWCAHCARWAQCLCARWRKRTAAPG